MSAQSDYEALRDAEPEWKRDGLGLRGTLFQEQPAPSTPYPLANLVAPDLQMSESGRRPADANRRFAFPFQVTLSKPSGLLSATVGNGELIFLFQQNDIAIGDLDTPFNVAIGDLMYLDIVISGLSGPTSASIYKSYSSGWSGESLNFPEPVDFNTDPSAWDGSAPAPVQTHAYLLIAEIIDDGDGNPVVRQCVHTNLQILPVSYYGLTVYVPFAGFGST